MLAAVAVAILVCVSICSGALVVSRSEPLPGRPPYTRTEKALLFLAGFVGWPFALAALLFIGLLFWDLLLYEDVLKEFEEEFSN